MLRVFQRVAMLLEPPPPTPPTLTTPTDRPPLYPPPQGYSPSSPVITWFWQVAEALDKEDRALLLQFVTGGFGVWLVVVGAAAAAARPLA